METFDTKKKIYSSIAGIVFLILSYCTFQFFLKNDTANPWYFVPNSTIVTLEITEGYEQWEQLATKEIAPFIQNFSVAHDISNQVVWLDSVLRSKEYTIHDLLGQKKGLMSFHFLEEKNSLETIIYLPLLEQDLHFKTAIESFFEADTNQFILKKEQLVEGNCMLLIDKKKRTKFHFLIQENVFVGTYSKELIREVLNQIDVPNKKIIKQKKAHESYSNQDEKVKIYVNIPQFVQVLNHHTSVDNQALISALELFSEHTFLNVKIENQSILLNGFTYNPQNSSFLNCFQDQEASTFKLAPIISNKTLTLNYFSISDGEKFKNKLIDYWLDQGIDLKEKFNNAQNGKQLDVDFLYEDVKGTLAYSVIQNPKTQVLERIMYLPFENIERAEKMVLDLAKSSNPTVNKSNYQGYQITSLNIQDFPYLFFGEYCANFGESFYTRIQNHLVISTSRDALKLLIDDIEVGNIWSRSSSHNLDIEQFLLNSTIGFYMNSQKVVGILNDFLSLEGKKTFKENKKQLSPIQTISLQFTSDKKNVFFTSWGMKIGKVGKIVRDHKQVNSSSKNDLHKYDLWEQDLSKKITSPPFIVTNHNDYSKEVFIQDEENKVILLSKSGRILWEYDVKGQIISEVFQPDIYKNNKKQYLFATEDKIFCLDRRGTIVKGFPIAVKSSKIQTLTLIDYDGSKKYRLLCSTNKNELRMYDVNGKNLKGWNPQKIQGKLIEPAKHIRVKGKDVILAIQEDGKIHLWNRSGREIANFPIDIKTPIQGQIFVSKEKNIKKSTITFLTQKGEILKYNLKGEQLFAKQLTEGKEKAKLILNVEESEYCIVHQKQNQLYFLNNYLQEQFLLPMIDHYDITKTQYYTLDNKQFLYINYGSDKGYVHLEQKNKKKITEQEIETNQKIALLYHQKSRKYTIYKICNTKILVEEVKKMNDLY